jgi:hypothetical protein
MKFYRVLDAGVQVGRAMIDEDGTGHMIFVWRLYPFYLQEKAADEPWVDGKYERLPDPGCNQSEVAESAKEKYSPF